MVRCLFEARFYPTAIPLWSCRSVPQGQLDILAMPDAAGCTTPGSGSDNPLSPDCALPPNGAPDSGGSGNLHRQNFEELDPTLAQQNVYTYVLEALLLLATDPSPKASAAPMDSAQSCCNNTSTHSVLVYDGQWELNREADQILKIKYIKIESLSDLF